jgi:hypothetical protein
VALAYPFGDIVIVFLVVLAVRGMTTSSRMPLWCLLGGLLAMVLSDSTYAYLTEVASYSTGNLLDVGWVAGYLAIALGAFTADADESTAESTAEKAGPSPPSLPSVVVPFLPVIGALGVAAIEIKSASQLDDVALLMVFALTGLVLARQALLLLDFLAPRRDHEAALSGRLTRTALGDVIAEPTASRGRGTGGAP